jgi:predicted Kef-type K+ transport protein
VEPVRNIFAALFLASVGMLMHPAFLWHHLDVLLASLLLLFFGKAVLVATVVRLFGYSPNVALIVGVALAQIGEFSFVLLARAKSLGLVPRTLYAPPPPRHRHRKATASK